jgi:hypothetical protein
MKSKSIVWPGIPGDFYFKFQLPVMKTMGSLVDSVRIRLTGTEEVESSAERLESLEEVAKSTFEIKKPVIYLKTVLRSVTKGILAREAKKGVKKNSNALGGFIFSLATDVATDLSENADLRIAHYFPAEAFIAETEVPPGTYQAEIDYLDRNGNLLFTDSRGEIEAKQQGLTLVESFLLE